jgi:glycosyltransferase involved in cell wall biosynthesis
MRPFRLAIIASHVIQYQGPLFQALANSPEIDLTVLFCSRQGLGNYHDKGFGRDVKWDTPLLDGYRSEFIPNHSPCPNASRFWGLINPAVIRRLREGGFDAVWVHGWANATNWMAMLTAVAAGVPLVVRGESNTIRSPGLAKRILRSLVLRALFKRVSGFLIIGSSNVDFYRSLGVPEDRMFFTPYAVDNDFFLAQADSLAGEKAELKRKEMIPENCPVVLFSGKLIPRKRPMDALLACEELLRDQKAALIFLGDGPLRHVLEGYVSQKQLPQVHFPGFRNQTELAKFFVMADAFVLPSDHDSWGLVVNEAMCFGLPVVVSDAVGAAVDLVKQGLNGFVYSAGDVAGLAQRLREVLADPVRSARMGRASRQLVQEWGYKEDVMGVLACLQWLRSRTQEPHTLAASSP